MITEALVIHRKAEKAVTAQPGEYKAWGNLTSMFRNTLFGVVKGWWCQEDKARLCLMMPSGTQRAQAEIQAVTVKSKNFITVCVVKPHHRLTGKAV